MFPWIILALACLFLFVEFYIPSGAGIFVTIALLIYAIYSACIQEGIGYCTIFIPSAFILMGLTVWAALTIIKKSARNNTFVLSHTQPEEGVESLPSKLLHSTGRTVTPLSPSGMVDINGERIPSISQGVYIEKGKTVIVTKVLGTHCLVVEKN